MKESTIHHDFKGYGGYSLIEGEKIIRSRLTECFEHLRLKNEECLEKARSDGKEKLLSLVVSIHKRIERLAHDIKNTGENRRFKSEKLSDSDEERACEIDEKIQTIIDECADMMGSMSCSQGEMHIIDRYNEVSKHLREIEELYQERSKIFRKMYIYG